MRARLPPALAALLVALPGLAHGAPAQPPALSGQVVARDGGEPLGYATIVVTAQGVERARRLQQGTVLGVRWEDAVGDTASAE